MVSLSQLRTEILFQSCNTLWDSILVMLGFPALALVLGWTPCGSFSLVVICD